MATSFRFRSGAEATDLTTFLELCRELPESRLHLAFGDFEIWLRSIGEPELASVAMVQRLSNEPISTRLDRFLEAIEQSLNQKAMEADIRKYYRLRSSSIDQKKHKQPKSETDNQNPPTAANGEIDGGELDPVSRAVVSFGSCTLGSIILIAVVLFAALRACNCTLHFVLLLFPGLLAGVPLGILCGYQHCLYSPTLSGWIDSLPLRAGPIGSVAQFCSRSCRSNETVIGILRCLSAALGVTAFFLLCGLTLGWLLAFVLPSPFPTWITWGFIVCGPFIGYSIGRREARSIPRFRALIDMGETRWNAILIGGETGLKWGAIGGAVSMAIVAVVILTCFPHVRKMPDRELEKAALIVGGFCLGTGILLGVVVGLLCGWYMPVSVLQDDSSDDRRPSDIAAIQRRAFRISAPLSLLLAFTSGAVALWTLQPVAFLTDSSLRLNLPGVWMHDTERNTVYLELRPDGNLSIQVTGKGQENLITAVSRAVGIHQLVGFWTVRDGQLHLIITGFDVKQIDALMELIEAIDHSLKTKRSVTHRIVRYDGHTLELSPIDHPLIETWKRVE